MKRNVIALTSIMKHVTYLMLANWWFIYVIHITKLEHFWEEKISNYIAINCVMDTHNYNVGDIYLLNLIQ